MKISYMVYVCKRHSKSKHVSSVRKKNRGDFELCGKLDCPKEATHTGVIDVEVRA